MTRPDARPAAAPSVSVVIPTYNRARLVGRAIASALAQNHADIEIIVVDDASTDDLAAAVAAFDDPRLRMVVHPRNRGAAAARNTGIAAARGEFVAFLDSDDIWFPDKLAQQVAAMRSQPAEVAGHVCAYDCRKAGDRPRIIAPGWDAGSFRRSQLFGCSCGPGTTLLCRRDIFAATGPFDEELRRLEDWDWLLRLSAQGYRLLASTAVLAQVDVGDGTSGRAIDAALRRIAERHQSAIAREGAAARRIFASTLHIESAAAAFGDTAYRRAVAELLRALACYPLRRGELYGRLLRRLIGRLARVGANRTPARAAGVVK